MRPNWDLIEELVLAALLTALVFGLIAMAGKGWL
jgi:hypothetical protein